MHRLPLALAAVALLAGCGGAKKSSEPLTALLTGVHVEAADVSFEFRSAPLEVKARYTPRASLAECGSGKRVPLEGRASVVVHFIPARTADIQDDKVIPTYTGPTRIQGPGPVLEIVKMCDFESDVGWAIGLERRLPLHVSRGGAAVTVSFG